MRQLNVSDFGRPRKAPRIGDAPILAEVYAKLAPFKDEYLNTSAQVGRSYVGNFRRGHLIEPSIVKIDKLLRATGHKLVIVPIEGER